jgi:hypothetical protein
MTPYREIKLTQSKSSCKLCVDTCPYDIVLDSVVKDIEVVYCD